MRIKSNWFKSSREHSPAEHAGAIAFNISRIAENALKNTRKAKFEVAIGPQYFAFLAEFLLFLIQVADRLAYRQFSAEDRFTFTSSLANHVATTYAENKSRLMGGELIQCKQEFIDELNLRAGEYAEFGYDENGPEFAFTRYLAFCMGQIMDEKDSGWIIDQIMGIEAPNAVDMLEKNFR
ncbi:MAG: hypothetical protein NTY60_05005, partial [Proteobacteria bacterium]|nr:hypothetical protein [Pseudomonadota bacterium]